ncbi:Nramp family divalent metal transporter [Streptomonospora wellingtoniae]|uniref:Nramp family divalent metal transporter n=1 Tax=Streptomonospora wellingtoniae TaxID=3075544 RepID=A0ABU2KNP8_9ACTN|nr:Nramp family divalent metal transporter [Streptomonospora sp. DSM 45055]MDT0300882.1 Nramp family divalent metal transporter [Streptomonospora sp. DSM 45055]
MGLLDSPTGAARSTTSRLRSGVALLGPAFVAAIAYVDPGNVATNVAAGASYGYLLVWVIVAANAMAFLVQYLSAKLGLVTGRSLPEALRERMPRSARLAYWAQAEVVAMATDLAEVLGGAIALRILFDVPLLLGGVITGVVSLGLLTLQNRYGQRPFERAVTGLLAVIALGFMAGLVVEPPSASGALGGLAPRFAGGESVLLAAGMLGATVMPHAVYVHSALARDRHGRRRGPFLQRLLDANKVDVGAAMLLAGAVNLALLLLAASALQGSETGESLEGAHAAVSANLGPAVGLLFAIGLLASGLSSTAVGCYAGAVVMDGLLRRRLPLFARRLITLLPALAVLALGLDPSRALVLSQVVLSFGIPFALVPLVVLTARRDVMGEYANGRAVTAAAAAVAVAVVALNAALVYLTATGS